MENRELEPGIWTEDLSSGLQQWLSRGNTLPKAYETGHRTRFSDSSIYDEVCVLCGARDAAGDDSLERPCPSPLVPRGAVCDDLDPVVAGPDPVEATPADQTAALERDARRWRTLQNYVGLAFDDATGFKRDTLSDRVGLRFMQVRISSLRPDPRDPHMVEASRMLTELIDCAVLRSEQEGWWDPEEPIGGFS